MFASLGTTEWIIITVILVLLIGSKKIPDFFRAVSDGFKEFKKASKDTGEEPGKSA